MGLSMIISKQLPAGKPLGLKKGKVILSNYNKEWPLLKGHGRTAVFPSARNRDGQSLLQRAFKVPEHFTQRHKNRQCLRPPQASLGSKIPGRQERPVRKFSGALAAPISKQVSRGNSSQ